MRRIVLLALGLLLLAGPATAQAARSTVITVQPGGFAGSDGYVVSRDNDPGFWFSAYGDGGTPPFECRMDTGEWTACSSPARYTDLPDGVHTFAVRTVEDGGVGSPATYTWRVDTTGPVLELTGKPAKVSNVKNPTFTYSYTDASMQNSYVLCAIDIGQFQSCSSPGSFGDLADGVHSVSYQAFDTAENRSNRVDYTWRIDTVAPSSGFTSGPTGTTSSRDAGFGFSGSSDTAGFECKLDAAEYAGCTSPLSLTGLADGEHTVQVRATDEAGNVGSPASRTWTVSTDVPDTVIETGPSGLTNVSSATFVLTGGTSFECKLDGAAAFSACTSPVSYSGLAEGAHTLLVRAVNAAGTVDPTPAERKWRVDTVAPDSSIDGGPTGTVASAAAVFGFSADEGAAYQCKLDGGAYAACESPISLDGLAQGAHTLLVRATDAAGNQEASPASRTWTVDTLAPVVSLTAKPGASTTATTATFSFVADEAATFECRIGEAAFAPCTSPKAYEGLTPGSRTFQVRATDALGHRSEAVGHTWSVADKPVVEEPVVKDPVTEEPVPSVTPAPTVTPETKTPPAAVTPRTVLAVELGSLRLRTRDRLKVVVSSSRAATVALVLRSGRRASKPLALTIAAGGTATARVKLPNAMRVALRKKRRLKVLVTAAAADGAIATKTATLRARR